MVSLSFLIFIIFVLLTVAFFTLMELKLLGFFHLRLGPDKVGPFGYFQSLSDFVKLFEKSSGVFSSFLVFFFFFSPFLGVFLGFFIWTTFLGVFSYYYFSWTILFFFCLTSLSVFFFLLSGWSSGSVFSSLGSFRAAVQVISYEVSMFFILINLMFFFFNFSINYLFFFSFDYSFFLLCFPLFFCWLICILAESNRPPFDFSEGESELVSGFNIEYSGGLFSLIFMAEYSFMIFFSFMTVLFFFGSEFLFLKFIFFCFFYIWVRGSFPRLRFDKLMMFNWKSILPLVLSYFFLFCGFSLF